MTPILSLCEKTRNGNDAAWENYEERDQSRYVKSISTTEDEIILCC